jgi:hypothetical protein
MRTDHSRIWLMALLVGVALAWPLPLGGVLLAVVASFGLVISWEADLSGAVMAPAPSEPVLPSQGPA